MNNIVIINILPWTNKCTHTAYECVHRYRARSSLRIPSTGTINFSRCSLGICAINKVNAFCSENRFAWLGRKELIKFAVHMRALAYVHTYYSTQISARGNFGITTRFYLPGRKSVSRWIHLLSIRDRSAIVHDPKYDSDDVSASDIGASRFQISK